MQIYFNQVGNFGSIQVGTWFQRRYMTQFPSHKSLTKHFLLGNIITSASAAAVRFQFHFAIFPKRARNEPKLKIARINPGALVLSRIVSHKRWFFFGCKPRNYERNRAQTEHKQCGFSYYSRPYLGVLLQTEKRTDNQRTYWYINSVHSNINKNIIPPVSFRRLW